MKMTLRDGWYSVQRWCKANKRPAVQQAILLAVAVALLAVAGFAPLPGALPGVLRLVSLLLAWESQGMNLYSFCKMRARGSSLVKS